MSPDTFRAKLPEFIMANRHQYCVIDALPRFGDQGNPVFVQGLCRVHPRIADIDLRVVALQRPSAWTISRKDRPDWTCSVIDARSSGLKWA